MTFKINLHAHTRNSDGEHSLLEMAGASAALGHSAFVVTDHDHQRKAAFQANRAELRVLKEHNLIFHPVIIGAEIKTPWGDHLLFGSKANKQWATRKVQIGFLGDKKEWISFFKDTVLLGAKPYSYGLILCHPRNFAVTNIHSPAPKEWWDLVHGFEIQNHDELYDDESKYPGVVATLRALIPRAVELRNSDAHNKEDLALTCNEIEKNIVDESQLIAYLTNIRLGKTGG